MTRFRTGKTYSEYDDEFSKLHIFGLKPIYFELKSRDFVVILENPVSLIICLPQ